MKKQKITPEFQSLFGKLAERHGAGEVWNDWIYACAVFLSLADRKQASARQQEFRRIWNRYSPAEQKIMNDLFALLAAGFEQDPFSDLLGELYMELGLCSTLNAQFFTPPEVTNLISRFTLQDVTKQVKTASTDWVSLCDPACGSGALLIAAVNTLFDDEINYQERCFFIAQDISSTVGHMCYIQLALMGCAGIVKIGDTLSDPFTGDPLLQPSSPSLWQTPRCFTEPWTGRRQLRQLQYFVRRTGASPTDTASQDTEVSPP